MKNIFFSNTALWVLKLCKIEPQSQTYLFTFKWLASQETHKIQKTQKYVLFVVRCGGYSSCAEITPDHEYLTQLSSELNSYYP